MSDVTGGQQNNMVEYPYINTQRNNDWGYAPGTVRVSPDVKQRNISLNPSNINDLEAQVRYTTLSSRALHSHPGSELWASNSLLDGKNENSEACCDGDASDLRRLAPQLPVWFVYRRVGSA